MSPEGASSSVFSLYNCSSIRAEITISVISFPAKRIAATLRQYFNIATLLQFSVFAGFV